MRLDKASFRGMEEECLFTEVYRWRVWNGDRGRRWNCEMLSLALARRPAGTHGARLLGCRTTSGHLIHSEREGHSDIHGTSNNVATHPPAYNLPKDSPTLRCASCRCRFPSDGSRREELVWIERDGLCIQVTSELSSGERNVSRSTSCALVCTCAIGFCFQGVSEEIHHCSRLLVHIRRFIHLCAVFFI